MYSQMTDGEFCCSFCGKKCKSKSGLTRHKSAKHARHEGSMSSASIKRDDNHNIFNINDFITLVNQSCKSLEKDTCYAESVRESFKAYVFKIAGEEDKERFSQVKKLYSFVRKGKVEKFYAKYFASVVSIASEYFPQLPFQSSVLLATRLADKIASFKKDSNCKMTSEHKSTASVLNEKEKAALQYLGGYVLFNLHKRIRKSKTWMTNSKQQVLAVLQAGKQINDCETAQALVDCVNRGGLWKISQTVEQIFTIAEINFKNVTTESEEPITKISKTDIVDNLEKNPKVDSLFQEWVSSTDLEISKDVSKDILHQVLLLYIKVRSFSFAKDVINKHKSQQKSSKSKALRKEIKNSSDKPPINE
jgi:Fe-S-cluster containining protein